jgi:hypothetical protein
VSVLHAKGGLCDKMKQLGVTTQADQQAILQPLIDIVNTPTNLVLFTAAAQTLKPALVTKSLTSGNSTAEIANPIPFLAMVDYLNKTKVQSLNTAAKLDAALKRALVDQDGNVIPVTGSFSTAWSTFLDFAQASKALTDTAAKTRIQKLTGVAVETQRYATIHPCDTCL